MAHTPQQLKQTADQLLSRSEARHAEAAARREQLRADARQHLQVCANARRSWWQRLRGIPAAVNPGLVEVVTDHWAAADPRWKGATEDGRWLSRQASEYYAAYNAATAETHDNR